MSLITKYRPKTWDEVIGQDAVVKAFKRSIQKVKSHAYLLHGPSGTGKTTLARIAAAGAMVGSADCVEVDAATFSGVDDTRALTQSMGYRPISGGNRAIIMDECHVLSATAWKALLKSVEEPPEFLFWFFCTTDIGKVPETIKTRCTSFKLKEVDWELLQVLLLDIAKREGVNVSEEVIELCAEKAKGSPRQAISNLAACLNVKDTTQARSLLEEAEGKEEIIALARKLLGKASWWEVQKTLVGLKQENGESVRHVIRAYMTTVILGAKKADVVGRAGEVLSEFSEPFPSGDGFSPVVMACVKLCL